LVPSDFKAHRLKKKQKEANIVKCVKIWATAAIRTV